MTEQRHYQSPAAFKQALERRLKTASNHGADFSRRRQLLVFDRFLARITQVFGDAVMLKGGLVLELRLARARTTKDIDLRMMGEPADVLAKLQEAGQLDLADFMRFEVQSDPRYPTIEAGGRQYEGYRFRASCMLAGKIYGGRFGVDVAYGDPIACDPDLVIANDLLGFAGISPPSVRLYPVVTHIAEKLHAYTVPRIRPNSRIKDLPDMALLASAGSLDASLLRAALKQTFEFRATHPLPDTIPRPPGFWDEPYQAMAFADELLWPKLGELHGVVAAFLEPVLRSDVGRTWNPQEWTWLSLAGADSS